MAIDSGTVYWTSPVLPQATEAGCAVAGNVTPAGVKAAFVAIQPTDIYEVGAVIGTVTAATTYSFSVAVDEKIGGTLSTTGSNFVTVTGPAGAAITAGFTLKKSVKMRVPKGGCLVFTVIGAPASGTAMLYAIGAVAGGSALGAQAAAGGLGTASPPLINEILSTT